MRTICNLIGNPKCGKDMATRRLAAEGFYPVTPSDIIAGFALENGLEISDRASYRRARQQMLAEKGRFIIPETILDLPYDDIAIAGMRVPAEMDMLRREANAFSIAMWCPQQARLSRAVESPPNPKDPRSPAEFAQVERAEYYSDCPELPAVIKTMLDSEYDVDASLPKQETLAQVQACLADRRAQAGQQIQNMLYLDSVDTSR